ncbi:hypothetical protein HSX10_03590 [Winogradskyella undariae]|uniref:hypothetical protein n=1 Tax=Winogradskyella undariae TaxID=1285465 RepID=UPI00156B2CC3|nr:hypothetical protein [Winogradskyella undariae]NRR90642.1 hypothetical protein [Winogradskyella undariae]
MKPQTALDKFLIDEARFETVRKALQKLMFASTSMFLKCNDDVFFKELEDGLYYVDRIIDVMEEHHKSH